MGPFKEVSICDSIKKYKNKKYMQIKKIGFLFLGISLLGTAFLLFFSASGIFVRDTFKEKVSEIQGGILKKDSFGGLKKFSSEEEFKKYLEESEELASQKIRGFGESSLDRMALKNIPSSDGVEWENPVETRVSQTNVQFFGIDEPDIVKTDGDTLYFSRRDERYYYDDPRIMDGLEEESGVSIDEYDANVDVMPRPPITPLPPIGSPRKSLRNAQEISLIDIFPVENMSMVGKIETYGEMLLFENILVVFSEDESGIIGFDITDRKNPQKVWNVSLKENSSLVQARKLGEKLYIASSTWIEKSRPCPVYPLYRDEEKVMIPCDSIYYPTRPAYVDSTYAIMTIDPRTGSTEDMVSFVGSSGNSVFSMNENFAYVTYDMPGDEVSLLGGFLLEQKDLFSKEFLGRVEKISSYEISADAKIMEIQKILEQETFSYDEDKQLTMNTELENRMSLYGEKRKRDFHMTHIVKVDLDTLSLKASASVPGRILNQFSMDEYKGNLRVATTIDANGIGYLGRFLERVNDVYILGENLEQRGSIVDMGLDERIYSVRFIGEKGYIVTFRETDPFYVLDVSDPDNPKKSGELKIPGYSSYLHPLKEDLILGIGMEEGSVKVSLFDVSSLSDPQEVGRFHLNEYWSEAVDNHHAFLHDADNQVFFLPGSQGGYVFSYAQDNLKLQLASKDQDIQRALYRGNNLYVIGKNSISVYDEKNWSKIKEFSFEN